MSENIEDDVINEEDAVNEVKSHIEEERKIERMLGNRYIAKINDDEAGSTIGEINQKNHPQLMMQQFLQEYSEKVEKENMQQEEVPDIQKKVSRFN